MRKTTFDPRHCFLNSYFSSKSIKSKIKEGFEGLFLHEKINYFPYNNIYNSTIIHLIFLQNNIASTLLRLIYIILQYIHLKYNIKITYYYC